MKLTFRIKQSPDIVFDYLSDMQKFVKVHPIITQIEPTGENTYLVHETLTFAFIPFSFTYPSTVLKDRERRTVMISAVVFKMTKIEITFTLREDGTFTMVEEDIIFKSPLPLKPFMKKIFEKQHRLLFRNIEQIPNAATT
jgi:carbon monoxide dehydrogenase subunit G